LFKLVLSIRRLVKANQIDTLILNGNRPIYLSVLLPAKKIAYRHTTNEALNGARKIIGILLLHIGYFFCKKIVVLYNKAVEQIRFMKGRVVVIPNGIVVNRELCAKNDATTALNFVAISRLDEEKGLLWLFECFSKIFPNRDDVSLYIAGEGNYRAQLEKFIISHPNVKIKLLGFVQDVTTLLRNSSVFVLPSKFECFPISILEAMNNGLPIIATDVGGTSEIVEDSNGFLIKYGDDQTLCETLRFFDIDRAALVKMGLMSTEIINRFSTVETINRLNRMLENI
jgi:glycosyltransferase involved in cell wall biosynthesis